MLNFLLKFIDVYKVDEKFNLCEELTNNKHSRFHHKVGSKLGGVARSFSQSQLANALTTKSSECTKA